MTTSPFATHKQLLDTDNDYRRRFGLPPLGNKTAEIAVSQTAQPAPQPETPLTGDRPVIAVDPELWRQVLAWKIERVECRRRDKELTALIDEHEGDLVDQYVTAGTDQIRLDGVTGTLDSKLWAKKINEETTQAEVAAALRADGLGHMVTPEGYHGQTMAAYLRDLEREKKPLPPHLAALIEPHEVWSVKFTKPTKSRAAARMSGALSSVLDGASGD